MQFLQILRARDRSRIGHLQANAPFLRSETVQKLMKTIVFRLNNLKLLKIIKTADNHSLKLTFTTFKAKGSSLQS